ncbi:hypothetical protein DFH06DRAFT_1472427 [Mycena polygramma]|nr:hypothetical protein DFH06DRAFT_1472427 [Mycena polygramma]
MSFSYLQQPFFAQEQPEEDALQRPTGGIHFQLPEYLYDAPPTLAPGGGAEAFHPAQAAQWFANSGFDRYPQYRNADTTDDGGSSIFPAVQDAYDSLEELHGAFPVQFPPQTQAQAHFSLGEPLPLQSQSQWSPAPQYVNSSLKAQAQPAHPWSLNAPPPPDEPSPLTASGLPVYSQSGFDIVSLLARVQNRTNPTIRLGPVDFTTSFVVVDVRRHDDPIVYCSPNFCSLTGYKEREVLGRNCRFLQAPPGECVGKGDARRHTSGNAVRALGKAVGGRKEAQVSVVNYRKDGTAFVNLVSVVPLFGEHVDSLIYDKSAAQSECVWFVGFQVDLTAQSEGIVSRVREGRYYSGAVVAISMQQQERARSDNANANAKTIEGGVGVSGGSGGVGAAPTQREKRSTAVPAPRVSAALARLLGDKRFLASCGVLGPALSSALTTTTNANENATATATASTTASSTTTANTQTATLTGLPPDPTSHALHSLLLGELPDFVHVLSLKGAFLYVAPAVTRVLGWEPAELVGRALADVCFARDVVSVGRALKEASLPVDGAGRVEAEKGGGEKGPNLNNPNTISNKGDVNASVSGLIPADALRTVDLVFRARTKQGSWVWVECRGRLHVEPGKGRKAIVLVGRARGMARVPEMGDGEVPRGYSVPRTSGYAYAPQTAPHSPTSSTYPATRSPAGSVSGLEYALQPKRARIEGSTTRGSSSTLRTPSPDPSASAAVPTAFHGMVDPHGLLLSVGAGVRALLGWEPQALRGTRLGALVAPDNRLSVAGAQSPVDALFAAWRAARAADPANAAASTREVRCALQGKDGPVDAVVRLIAPLPQSSSLPPAVAPAHLMYAVRAAGAPFVPRAAGEDAFKRLDPATGGSWQYELQQLRFANARLEEEIGELERAEAERTVVREREREGLKERQRERERERERVRTEQRRYGGAYQQQQLPVYGYDEQQQWSYPAAPAAYHLPMKRAWDRRDDV